MENNRFEEEKMRLNVHLNFLGQLLLAQTGILPIVATISAAMLVVASFNEKLLPLTHGVRIALIVLLMVIPASLFSYLFQVGRAVSKSKAAIDDVVGEDVPMPQPKCMCEKIVQFWFVYSSYFFALIITAVIVYFVWLLRLGF